MEEYLQRAGVAVAVPVSMVMFAEFVETHKSITTLFDKTPDVLKGEQNTFNFFSAANE